MVVTVSSPPIERIPPTATPSSRILLQSEVVATVVAMMVALVLAALAAALGHLSVVVESDADAGVLFGIWLGCKNAKKTLPSERPSSPDNDSSQAPSTNTSRAPSDPSRK